MNLWHFKTGHAWLRRQDRSNLLPGDILLRTPEGGILKNPAADCGFKTQLVETPGAGQAKNKATRCRVALLSSFVNTWCDGYGY